MCCATETKILKRLVRDIIDPGRGLGHVDREHATSGSVTAIVAAGSARTATGTGLNGDEKASSMPEGKDVVLDGGLSAAEDAAGTTATMAAEDLIGDGNGRSKAVQCEDCT